MEKDLLSKVIVFVDKYCNNFDKVGKDVTYVLDSDDLHSIISRGALGRDNEFEINILTPTIEGCPYIFAFQNKESFKLNLPRIYEIIFNEKDLEKSPEAIYNEIKEFAEEILK